LSIASDPDIALVIDEHAVLVLRPVVALGGLGSAPGFDDFARLVEFDDRRRGIAADRLVAAFGALVAIVHRARALADPNVVVLIDEDAADLTEDPIVWERLGPTRVDFEFRRDVRGKSECDERERGHGCEPQCTSNFHQPLLRLAEIQDRPCLVVSADPRGISRSFERATSLHFELNEFEALRAGVLDRTRLACVLPDE